MIQSMYVFLNLIIKNRIIQKDNYNKKGGYL